MLVHSTSLCSVGGRVLAFPAWRVERRWEQPPVFLHPTLISTAVIKQPDNKQLRGERIYFISGFQVPTQYHGRGGGGAVAGA